MRDIAIFGTGGFAREVHELLEDLIADGARWNFVGFLDGDVSKHGSLVHDKPVLGAGSWLRDHHQTEVVVGIGSTAVRRRIVSALLAQGHTRFATLVHPRAWLGRRVQVGAGSVICAGCNLTTNITVGEHVIINLDCTVGHDSVLEDFVTIAPSVNVSGSVVVAEGCDLGTGGAIIQGVSIGSWSVVGAGSVVVRDLPANVTAVGVPARTIKERDEGWHLKA